MTEPTDPIMLSALQHYEYCKRQCALIHIEQSFAENVFTLRGQAAHERVDQQRHETSAGARVEYALPVWNHRLGLTGRCDAVEFRPNGILYPVEYKLGKRKTWLSDNLQLAAQAVCLEEMTGKEVPVGAIFHVQSRRRREVQVDAELRGQLENAVNELRRLLASGRIPPPHEEKWRCQECSLIDLCQPEAISSSRWMRELENLFNPAKD